MSLTLDITICTYGHEGLMRTAAMILPPMPGVRYIVSWQMPGESAALPLPPELSRADIIVSQIDSRGLSANRNNAISLASADIIYIADDDISIYPDGLRAMLDTFESRPQLDIAALRYDGTDAKRYPDTTFDLRRPPRGYYLSSIELCFRRRVFDSGLRFSTLLGIGAPVLGAGEEANIVHRALCRGFAGRFFPITIARHDGLSTGNHDFNPRAIMAEGASHSYLNRYLAPAKMLVAAYRHKKSLSATLRYYRFLLKGYVYGLRHFRRNGDERP